MKKYFFLLSLLFPLFSVSAEFSDTHGISANKAISYLQEEGVVNGFNDETYRPENTITRAEFLKIILGSKGEIPTECTPTKTFSDVEEGAWYAPIICEAVNTGIVNGYGDGTFQPNKPISFAEGSKIVSNVHELGAIEAKGEKWFLPFVEVIDEQRIMPNIEDIQQPLSRGEMAEIAWGVMTGHEVENKSRGILPEISSCDDLVVQLQKYEKRNTAPSYYGRGDMVFMEEEMMFDDAEMGEVDAFAGAGSENMVAAPMEKSTSADSATEYSTTNIQEFGVDEADIIKNDGSHIFLIKGETVRILRAYPAEELKQDSIISVGNYDSLSEETKSTMGVSNISNFHPQEMYLDGDTLTILGNSGGNFPPISALKSADMELGDIEKSIAPGYYGGSQMISVIVLDISDRKNPKEIRRVSIEGNMISSRKIEDTVYLASQKWNQRYHPTPMPFVEEEIMPRFSDSARSEETTLSSCSGLRYIPNFTSNNFLSIAAIDTKNISKKVQREVVLGGGDQLYSSSQNMYITRSLWDEVFWEDDTQSGWKNDEMTEIYRFSLQNGEVKFAAKGKVLGRILNQFSMSEFGDYFRIATQVGQAWGNALSETQVSILDMNLKEVSGIDGIAPGENMKSARFLGKKGYLVTFKTVDPLFVLDLDPQDPQVLGKLKIPGWSDYLHPYDDDHLIGFGKEVDESIDADKVHSDNAVYYTAVQGMKVSIFDVSDLENPKETHKMVIGDRGTTSELLNNHKALLFDKDKGVLGFPITITKNTSEEKGINAQIQTIFDGAILLNISLENGFSERGRSTNYKDDTAFKKSGEYFYGDQNKKIKRILYIGEYFYTVAQNYVQALSWDDLQIANEIQIDEIACNQIRSEVECLEKSHCKAIYKNTEECVRLFGEDIVCGDTPVFRRCE